jgi:cytochrome bd-type quinol oxidase subunit 1
VHSGTALFTLIGFAGLYSILTVLFLFLVGREIAHGPDRSDEHLAGVPAHGAGGSGRG